jgi:tRNA(adenine34) deaminase
LTADSQWMSLALEQAQLAANSGEVPVGAVVVKDGQLIAVGRNAPVAQHDPSAHAEIVALRSAAQTLQNYRLDGCELFVTLEPCAMCAGAITHSRLARVIYGASDPKTGAAGSVLDVFGKPQINHQTRVTAGVMAQQCGDLLQNFFQQRRNFARQEHVPIREDALRTPDVRFAALVDFPYEPHYVVDLPELVGLRMHYIDEGPVNAPHVFVCLHASTRWSYAFRRLISEWVASGARVLAPDLIGFGKSDKPKRADFHSWDFHIKCLKQWMNKLELHNAVLVLEGDARVWGHALLEAHPKGFQGLLLTGLQDSENSDAAYEAPFVDNGYRAGPKALAALLKQAGANNESKPSTWANFAVLEQCPVSAADALVHFRIG